MHKKTAVLLLSVLKKYKKIRAYKLQAFLMSKGVGGIYYYNYIRRFEKEGIIYRKKKMVKNVPYVLVYLNPDVDIDAIIESINNDSLYTNYETFKRHLIPFLEENKIVRKTELEDLIRRSLHRDITTFNMQTLIRKAVKDGLLFFVGMPKIQGFHSNLYASSSHFVVKNKIPTIKNLYEKIIVKKMMEKKKVEWAELRELAEEQLGIVTPKFRKAFRNLITKKYIIHEGDRYVLNENYDYEEGFRYMPRYAKKGERQTVGSKLFF